MIRILIFILFVIFFVGAITLSLSFDSRIAGEAFGFKFDWPSGAFIAVIAASLAAVAYITHFVKNLMAIPGKIKAHDREEKRKRGVTALTRGLEAIAVGDAPAATHHAQIARRHLDDVSLTRLLTAQAAQLGGDKERARESFQAMLAAPETEFLGLKGLYLNAVNSENFVAARDYAKRALSLRPNAQWAFEAVFDLGLRDGAWRETREAVDVAARNKLIGHEESARAGAALKTADAYISQLEGNSEEAIKEIETALKKAADFPPAALLAARIYRNADNKRKASKVLESAYAVRPHISLVIAYDELQSEKDDSDHADALEKLAARNSDARDSAYLRARAALLREQWQAAFDEIEAAVGGAPFSHEAAIFAEAIAGIAGAEVARPWFQRAAVATGDPRAGADGEFQLTREGWAQLIREYTYNGRLSPLPLEQIKAEFPTEDAKKLLLAPPTPPEENLAVEGDEAENDGADAAQSDDSNDASAIGERDNGSPSDPDEAVSSENKADGSNNSESETKDAAALDNPTEQPTEETAPEKT